MEHKSVAGTKREGQCLCSKVKLTAKNVKSSIGVCHCSMCRKFGGLAHVVDSGTDVSFQGEDNIKVYNSSVWGERGFCKNCGSSLFYRLKEKQHYFIPVALFNDASGFVFDHQIFIEDKPSYYDFKNETVKMTGAEVMAQFA